MGREGSRAQAPGGMMGVDCYNLGPSLTLDFLSYDLQRVLTVYASGGFLFLVARSVLTDWGLPAVEPHGVGGAGGREETRAPIEPLGRGESLQGRRDLT